MTIEESIRPLKVAIVGGGPGGLATAIAPSKIPHVEVKIYEQASILREVGAGISIGQNTSNALELLGGHAHKWSCDPSSLAATTEEPGCEVAADPHPMTAVLAQKCALIGTQRMKLQSVLLAHVPPGVIELLKKLIDMVDKGKEGVEVHFMDETVVTVDLVMGAESGWHSFNAAWPDYDIKYTGTTIWRALLPWDDVVKQDPRFTETTWWHGPTTHVWLSSVGEGLGEIAARSWQDPRRTVPIRYTFNLLHTLAMFTMQQEYLAQIREVISWVKEGDWREFAAFAGPELSDLTAWDDKVALVGDASHALSGAFGSGAGFAIEDGWILA